MDTFLIFLGMSLATYATRYGMIAALGRDTSILNESEPSSPLRRWLKYVPPAVLSALIVPAVRAPEGRIHFGISLWVMLVGVAVAWRTRSAWWTVLSGLVSFWLLRAFGA